MGEGFKKQKRKFWQSAIIKSAVCGISFGLFVFAVLFAALKLAGIPLGALYYALITIGAALLCAGLCVLIFKPTDKKVAKQLDKRHDLDERVQTSLAYCDAEGAIVGLLQEDTDERLLNLPKEKFDFKRVWQFFLTGVLAIAVFLSAFFVPSNIAEGDNVGGGGGGPAANSPYQFSDDELDDLLTIIANVNASDLSAELKQSARDSLNRLIGNLDFAETISDRNAFVQSAINSIEKAVKQPLSYKALSYSLGRNYVGPLAKMVADGVQSAYDYVIIDYNGVVSFNAEKETIVANAVSENLDAFFDALMNNGESTSKSRAARDSEGENGQPSDGEEEAPVSFVVKTYTNMYIALTYSEVSSNDDLYKALYALASGMESSGDVLNNSVAYGFEVVFKRALSAQAYLLAMNKYLTNAVREVFGMQIPSDDVFVPEILEESEENPGDDDGETQGGYGKGDMLYGSDDLVYDPVTDRYVTYGELVNEYYAIVEAMTREGNLTKEQKDIIEAYFEILFSGLKEEE